MFSAVAVVCPSVSLNWKRCELADTSTVGLPPVVSIATPNGPLQQPLPPGNTVAKLVNVKPRLMPPAVNTMSA